jgi:hypothetical protein
MKSSVHISSEDSIKELRIIPGVGKSIAKDLYNIGIRKISDLQNANPEKLYVQSNQFAGVVQDPCLLYVFRCAVYYASHKKHNPEKLKWWNWKIPEKKLAKV